MDTQLDSIDKVEFATIISILEKILNTITSETDVVYTRFDNVKDAMNHIYNHLEHLRLFDYSVLKEIDLDFAPTGFYQELAMRNYWGDEYISLSKIFDTSYERLTSD